VKDTREMVERFIEPVEVHRPLPDGLRSAIAEGTADR